MIAERESFEAVNGKAMRKIHAEALIIDFLGGFIPLWFSFVLFLRTFGEDVLMAALVDNTCAH
jgi:hypothetical protein